MRKLGEEHVQIYSEVIVRQGNKVVAVGRNKFVGQALISLCNFFTNCMRAHSLGIGSVPACTNMDNLGFGATNIYFEAMGRDLTVRLGTDIVTPTAYSMITLVNVIATAPNVFTIDRDNPSAGVYRAKYTAVWNSGTVSGTVGELGLFCRIQKVLGDHTLSTMTIADSLWSRLSSAGGDFGSFTIDPTKPLSVEWRIVFQF